jgi:hypothetical protein
MNSSRPTSRAGGASREECPGVPRRMHPFFVGIWKMIDEGGDACWSAGLV